MPIPWPISEGKESELNHWSKTGDCSRKHAPTMMKGQLASAMMMGRRTPLCLIMFSPRPNGCELSCSGANLCLYGLIAV